MRVSVAWITPEMQDVVPVELPAGATIAEAVDAAGLVATYALDLAHLTIAVAGARRALNDVVHDGERIDLLRALTVDPKEARRHRARARPLPPRPPRRKPFGG
jgi:putative ubiquitin-RnfH superfamily antitoxin RatB of RatAB toxin-antitoxin module